MGQWKNSPQLSNEIKHMLAESKVLDLFEITQLSNDVKSLT